MNKINKSKENEEASKELLLSIPLNNIEEDKNDNIDSSSDFKHNIYFSSMAPSKFEEYSNKKYILVDFRSSLRHEQVTQLLSYFQKEEYQTDSVLGGYVADVLVKLFEVSSGQMIEYFCAHKKLFDKLIVHIDNFSVTQLLLLVFTDNFIVKEKKKKTENKSEFKNSTLELSYSNLLDSPSKNALFSNCSEHIIEKNITGYKENLQAGNLLLLKDIIPQEIAAASQRSIKGKQLLIETFGKLLELAKLRPDKLENSMNLLSNVYCKFVDLLSQFSDIEVMERANR